MIFDLTPSVRPTAARIKGAADAASRAVILAEESAANGSFGVGGILVGEDGQIFAEATNAVIRSGRVQDPTAHVERQLVDWYFQAHARDFKIEPDRLVIVSSIGPCAMCAGAILRSGIKVIFVAEDEMSGVHDHGKPNRMPSELWNRAENQMASFGIQGVREAAGANLGRFFSSKIPHNIWIRANRAFLGSLEFARRLVGGAMRSDSDLKAVYPTTASLHMESALPTGIWISSGEINLTVSSGHDIALGLLAQDGVIRNGAILVNRDGCAILGMSGAEDQSPARSAVLELIRTYVIMRDIAMKRFGAEFPHQRFCTVVKRQPFRTPDQALLDLGAIGSFLEQPRPSLLLPAFAYIERDGEYQTKCFAAALPPFYTKSVGVTVGLI